VAKSSKPGSKKKQSSPTRSKSKTKAAAPRKAKGKAKGKKAASRPYGAGTGENVIELRPFAKGSRPMSPRWAPRSARGRMHNRISKKH